MDAVAKHDHVALAEAYRQHGSRVHALARSLCGDARAEDLTQEIFLQLWNYPERFNTERGSLRSYLLMQAHRRAVDILRSDNARAAREFAQNLLVNAEGPGTEALALTLLERAELDELVSALPANERHPIVLAYLGGHTYRDVARLLGVPEGTIKSRIRSGLKRLRVEGASRLHLP
ncbi:MAG TPA: sigma-70 family RNA polymerase sigma factor [Acidimicrobiales bacterium]|nr:sigma-70 family RNA polymerase sigma factor [Acidimicrobiales bacterium]